MAPSDQKGFSLLDTYTLNICDCFLEVKYQRSKHDYAGRSGSSQKQVGERK